MAHSAQIGSPSTFIATLQQYIIGMCFQVVMACTQSSSFPLEVVVKHGCFPAPIILNQILVAITLVSHSGLQSSDCVGIEYRLDGGLFNLRRLKAKTKTSSLVISALMNADDAAFPALLLTDFNVVLMSYLKLASSRPYDQYNEDRNPSCIIM